VTDTMWTEDVLRDAPPLLTTEEVAALLRVHPGTVRRIATEGRLHPVSIAGAGASRLLFPRAEIARYLVACAERRAGAK